MIVLAFWGLTRSLRYTYPSIRKHILDVLRSRGVCYKIVIHTYVVPGLYTNVRAGESGLVLDNEEYKLLSPDEVVVDNQEEVRSRLQLEQYRSQTDPWNNGYQTMDNFILAMYSKMRVTEMISKYSPDGVIFLRPDVQYLHPLPMPLLGKDEIAIPRFHLYSGMNDRFAICTRETYLMYGNIFPVLLSYSRHFPLHSETCYARYLKHNKIRIQYVSFTFLRIRATGEIDERDKSMA